MTRDPGGLTLTRRPGAGRRRVGAGDGDSEATRRLLGDDSEAAREGPGLRTGAGAGRPPPLGERGGLRGKAQARPTRTGPRGRAGPGANPFWSVPDLPLIRVSRQRRVPDSPLIRAARTAGKRPPVARGALPARACAASRAASESLRVASSGRRCGPFQGEGGGGG